MSWADGVVARVVDALHDAGDPEWAEGAERYMKGVAPFLGIRTPDRRKLVRAALRGVPPPPSSDELGRAAVRLAELPEREYHYAAQDVIDRYLDAADDEFLERWVERLLRTTPWWDTVDGLGSIAVAPLTRRSDADALVDRWSASGDIWLVRAAIQHQRGRRGDTDVARVLDLCDRHWANGEFFVAKAIGWALRDLAALDAPAVRRFLDEQRAPNRVARREAERGLNRASG